MTRKIQSENQPTKQRD